MGGQPAVRRAGGKQSPEKRFFLLLREAAGVRSLRRSDGSSRTAAAPPWRSTLTNAVIVFLPLVSGIVAL